MKDFNDLKDDIRDEIRDAEKYIQKALARKETNPGRAEVYRKLAEGELTHMEELHDEIVKEIKQWREETGQEPPADMQAKYDLLHEIIMSDANKVRLLIKLYKET